MSSQVIKFYVGLLHWIEDEAEAFAERHPLLALAIVLVPSFAVVKAIIYLGG